MTNLDINVNVSLKGPIDVEKIAELVKSSISKEIERVGVKVDVANPKLLKVGDYAKALTDSKYRHVLRGDIVVVDDTDFNGQIVAKSLINKYCGIWQFGQLIRATDEEVVKAKAELAEKEIEEKWAKIGRKPNEFKEGDFVKYKKCVAEVIRVGIYDMSIEAPNRIIPITFESAKLITPVEARFDR